MHRGVMCVPGSPPDTACRTVGRNALKVAAFARPSVRCGRSPITAIDTCRIVRRYMGTAAVPLAYGP